eukprot:1189418-Prorocentrum_minimum.AAC.2
MSMRRLRFADAAPPPLTSASQDDDGVQVDDIRMRTRTRTRKHSHTHTHTRHTRLVILVNLLYFGTVVVKYIRIRGAPSCIYALSNYIRKGTEAEECVLRRLAHAPTTISSAAVHIVCMYNDNIDVG